MTRNEQAIRQLYEACVARDLETFLAVVHADVDWQLLWWLGGGTRSGRESLRDYMAILDAHRAQFRLNEVVELGDRAIARYDRSGILDDGTGVGGTEFTLFWLADGEITKCVEFAYRRDVLDAIGLPRAERQGVLIVRSDDDERLYHFAIQPEAEMTWARYEELCKSGHEHCEMCWATFSAHEDDQNAGYSTLDGYHWLCADCFDEVKAHFRLRLVE